MIFKLIAFAALTAGAVISKQSSCVDNVARCRSQLYANQDACNIQYDNCMENSTEYKHIGSTAFNKSTAIWITTKVPGYITYCPSATTWEAAGQNYTATTEQWVTVIAWPSHVTITTQHDATPTLLALAPPTQFTHTYMSIPTPTGGTTAMNSPQTLSSTAIQSSLQDTPSLSSTPTTTTISNPTTINPTPDIYSTATLNRRLYCACFHNPLCDLHPEGVFPPTQNPFKGPKPTPAGGRDCPCIPLCV